jgi:hypothetical protein
LQTRPNVTLISEEVEVREGGREGGKEIGVRMTIRER